MSEIWSDTNRFSQTGYSASTIFPKRENYKSQEAFDDDMEKANYRESNHLDWMNEERISVREDEFYDDLCDCDALEYDCWESDY